MKNSSISISDSNRYFGISISDVGHVKFLEKCRELGTYIIVGLHSDEVRSNSRSFSLYQLCFITIMCSIIC